MTVKEDGTRRNKRSISDSDEKSVNEDRHQWWPLYECDCIDANAGYDSLSLPFMERADGMSGISIPVSRPSGRVIVVVNPSIQNQPDAVTQKLGFECLTAADPYAAMAEICANPGEFHAVILSLQSLYREELSIIASIKRRFGHLEIWLMHTDGRQAALAEALRFGADGLLAEDGLHRIAAPATQPSAHPSKIVGFGGPVSLNASGDRGDSEQHSDQQDDTAVGEPVLTADELRALLQEQPSMPPSRGRDN